MVTEFVGSETARLYPAADGKKAVGELLWGDQVTVLESGATYTKVRARGRPGYVKTADLGGQSLLEVYFIDVGQGDGVLVRTPDGRHVLVDGGHRRAYQPTGKNAADFVDWKFAKDYGASKIVLDAMIASHCDADHYGGLWDLLNPAEQEELDLKTVEIRAFYHAGIGWWTKPPKGRYLGPVIDSYLTQLMGNLAAVQKALKKNANPKLQGEWAEFMAAVVRAGCPIARLSHKTGYLPGFETAAGKASIRVLAPYEETQARKPVLKSFGGDSQNTNGHSILLRLDYGRVRVLLTGDLNAKSQTHLLDQYAGNRMEFQCDVGKGCHHGSDDVSYAFLQAMNAAATVLSSGDSEGYSHPRPGIVAASATTGHVHLRDDKIVTPLIYSTEISRSYRLGTPTRVAVTTDGGQTVETTDLTKATVDYDVVMAGDLNPKHRANRRLKGRQVVDGIVYGLVNVRTDGETIRCATMNEKDHTWDVKTFRSRF